MEHAIQASGLVHRYGKHIALHGVDLACAPGKLVALLGPNGAGKTTLVKLLLGVFAPQQGSVRVAGGDPLKRATRQAIGTMLQISGVPENLTVGELADLYSAGVLATERGGHGTQYGIPIPTVDGPDQADAWVEARVAEGSDFIKIVIEPGRRFGISRPTLDQATVRALVTAAHARDLLAVAHVSMEADAIMAVDAGVDGLVHVFADRPASAEFLELARERGVFVVPTTVVIAGVAGQFDIDELLADERLAQRLSAEQEASLRGGGWNVPNGAAILARSHQRTSCRQPHRGLSPGAAPRLALSFWMRGQGSGVRGQGAWSKGSTAVAADVFTVSNYRRRTLQASPMRPDP